MLSSSSHTSVTSDAFRLAMRHHAASVVLVTTDGPHGHAGLTATAFSPVSDHPPIVLVCLNKQSRTASFLQANGRFAVNILSAAEEDLARFFASSHRSIDERFAAAGFASEMGLPSLSSATANLFCHVEAMNDVGSHRVFFGRVEGVRVGEGLPLIYHNQTYGTLKRSHEGDS